ncbi:13857_t:CDS:2, partial [Cetraspora pellucida]
ISRKLVNKNDLLAYEELKPKEMISKENTKVVKETGKWIVFVSPHNTSKRCSKCGEINEKLKDEEIFECSRCDNELDRDVNAARNIL